MFRESAVGKSFGLSLAKPRTSLATIIILTISAIIAAQTTEGYTSFILATAALNVIVGVGLNILIGLSGQISFGHVGFFAIGAYCSGVVMLAGYGFWAGLLVAGIVSAIVGGLLSLPALRVSGPYLAMMTIAFAFIIEHGAIEWRELTGGASGLMGFDPPQLFSMEFGEKELATLAVILAALSLWFFWKLSFGAWGLAMRAVKDSEIASQSIGLNPLVVKTISFVLSAFLTGIAGALFAPLNNFISPGSFPFFQSILFVFAVVIGGAGTIFGPLIGAIIVVMLPELLSEMAEYRLLIFGSLLLSVLWLAPKGLIGTLTSMLAVEDEKTPSPSGTSLTELLTELGQSYTDEKPSLTVKGLGKSFGGVHAASDIDFVAQPGQITSIIGPNGAGKTTVLNMIGGFYAPDQGSIVLTDELAGLSAHQISRTGISRTYQTTLLFDGISVLDNILIALKKGRLGSLLSLKAREKDQIAAYDLLSFVGYKGPLGRLAGNLPHVDKRLVEIARALATGPTVLLLDEPAAGLTRDDKAELAQLLRQISDAGVTVILVEHDMSLVMDISDHIVVLDAGRLLMEGKPEEVKDNPDVHRAYLGGTEFEGRPRQEPLQGEEVAVLTAYEITTGYGAAPVLEKVSITVNSGEMVGVLGANGAGKSTLLKTISGLHRPVEGSILLEDKPISHKAAYDIVAEGLSLVPEGRQVFPELSTRDNILLGGFRRDDQITEQELDKILERFPRLKDRMNSKAGVLSGGEQQMLAIARGLISCPKILLLDEPSLGLAPAMIGELYDVLADLRDEGVTILIVDQMANLTLTIADRAYVLNSGQVAQEGDAKDLKKNAAIEQAYLG